MKMGHCQQASDVGLPEGTRVCYWFTARDPMRTGQKQAQPMNLLSGVCLHALNWGA